MITRVLVANRGEIARRVFATCRRLGLGTVAVYTEPDSTSPHVGEADARVRLLNTNDYLNAEAIIAAAEAAGADAVHPGYGFLSENAEFAAAVQNAGLAWIGPPVDAVRAMGSKIESKKLMSAAGVPVLEELDPATVTQQQSPVLVKASPAAAVGACVWYANCPHYQAKSRRPSAKRSRHSATRRCSASATCPPGTTSRSR